MGVAGPDGAAKALGEGGGGDDKFIAAAEGGKGRKRGCQAARLPRAVHAVEDGIFEQGKESGNMFATLGVRDTDKEQQFSTFSVAGGGSEGVGERGKRRAVGAGPKLTDGEALGGVAAGGFIGSVFEQAAEHRQGRGVFTRTLEQIGIEAQDSQAVMAVDIFKRLPCSIFGFDGAQGVAELIVVAQGADIDAGEDGRQRELNGFNLLDAMGLASEGSTDAALDQNAVGGTLEERAIQGTAVFQAQADGHGEQLGAQGGASGARSKENSNGAASGHGDCVGDCSTSLPVSCFRRWRAKSACSKRFRRLSASSSR